MTEPTPTQSVSVAADVPLHRLSLIKGEECWVFRWETGQEAALISLVAELARDDAKPFDWIDAAAICRGVARPKNASTSKAP